MVKFAAMLVAAALLLTACGPEKDGKTAGGTGGDAAGAPAAAGNEPDAESPFLRRFPPSTSGGPAEPVRALIRDPAAWAELWAKANAHVAPVPKPPTVDFSKEMVAFAALGQKPTTGYSIEIVGTLKADGKTTILFVEREPSKGVPAAAVVTSPWHAVVMAKTDADLPWEKYEAPHSK